ncbi:MAG TPA: hypothetical protein VG816_04410 [Solirubrobacterales bacterium]|nr:hypothetical protein [Solirubrobacterales bacterium]
MCSALVIAALAALGLAASAQAKLVGEFTKFAQCPYTNAKAIKCIYSVTEKGEVILGSKKVPIEKPVTLQGAYAEPVEEKEEAEFYPFLAATNGITLSKAPQNVPGGLLGIIPEASQPALVKALIKFFFENSLTGVNSTLELAKPASEIRVSENNLAGEIGTALQMPVKVHLENPFLGKNCFVGSSSSPITWKLTTGTTNPPAPNKPITGSGGEGELLEKARILKLNNNKLVDNAWSAPKAAGCGGIISFLVDPIINSQLGTTTAGHNSAELKGTLYEASAFTVNKVNNENP